MDQIYLIQIYQLNPILIQFKHLQLYSHIYYMTLITTITLTGFISFTLYFILPLLLHAAPSVKEYPFTDPFYDRTYTVEEGRSVKYLHAYCKEDNVLSLSITPKLFFNEEPRFRIHAEGEEAPKMQSKLYTFFSACNVRVSVEDENPNKELIRIVRNSDNYTIFAIKRFKFVAEDHVEIETQDFSQKWGMGERFQTQFSISDGIWTIWNRDRPFQIDTGSKGRSGQTYGHQPLYLARQISSNFHIVYFKTTHAFNFQVKKNTSSIKYITTGSLIQFLIFVGEENPEELLKKYHSFIGPSHIPPFWAMGFHQSRWGYKNLQQFSSAARQFEMYRIPLDTMWSDLDYMKNMAIFTIDEENYPPKQMRSFLNESSLHYIPLIDVGVSLEDNKAVQDGKDMNIFLKSHFGTTYEGFVWPGKVHYVDYLHPNASVYWQSQLDRLYQVIPFSGVWLDMNQPTNFRGNQPLFEAYKVQSNETKNMMTIDANLEHYSTNSFQALLHHEVHAYFGHLSTLPTHEFLKKHRRPFIVTRSNSVGTGTYAAHWTGDNIANWEFMRLSIGGNFLFQIFGIQMVGADICGFHKNTNEELCSRWMQLGSFYPFSRNHNENSSIPQQPWVFGDMLLETSQISLNQRYSLLKQMYTTLVNMNGTGSFFRPIFFQFSSDSTTYFPEFMETQFMVGDYLMAAPILTEGQQTRRVYFPGNNEIWYQLQYEKFSYFLSSAKMKVYFSREEYEIMNILPAPLPLFLRGGRLIFTNIPVTRTSNLSNKFTIVAGLKDGMAKGQILAIQNYSSDSQVDKCILRGCTMKLTIMKEGEEFKMRWQYTGGIQLKVGIQIDKIKIGDGQKSYICQFESRLDGKRGEREMEVYLM